MGFFDFMGGGRSVLDKRGGPDVWGNQQGNDEEEKDDVESDDDADNGYANTEK